MKTAYLTALIVCSVAAPAQAQPITGTPIRFEEPSAVQERHDVIYGYSPDFLSEGRSYSSSAEEEGHYILGVSDRTPPAEPRMPPVDIPSDGAVTGPQARTGEGVLISLPRQTGSDEAVPRPASQQNVEQQRLPVNANPNLEKPKEQKWTAPF
jgi:hypothetical protein